ncbi:hypothetical protein CALCODRAFT_212884 [Calocera cornea HHB12733]|uniref:Uncharacterized protein n=1 Tax=Calocera cornea HHB12733 TaxID=1353952 RepID=A0A165HAM2_9BASI|nr:hypothetical protein CALCODRAFT_212884 [Calocera cornea HHB12733]
MKATKTLRLRGTEGSAIYVYARSGANAGRESTRDRGALSDSSLSKHVPHCMPRPACPRVWSPMFICPTRMSLLSSVEAFSHLFPATRRVADDAISVCQTCSQVPLWLIPGTEPRGSDLWPTSSANESGKKIRDRIIRQTRNIAWLARRGPQPPSPSPASSNKGDWRGLPSNAAVAATP